MTALTYTPETMLELAQACMPQLVPRIQKMRVGRERVPQVWVNGQDNRTGSDEFDPIGNPAHAWAVLKFLVKFHSYSPDKPVLCLESNLSGDGFIIYFYDTGIEGEGKTPEQANLAAAVAVMERMKGESK